MANQIKTFLLLGSFTLLVMLIGQAVGGRQGLYIAFAIAIVMNFGSYWFSGNLILTMNRAKVVNETEAPQLYQLVAHLAERANLPCPKVAIVDDPSPNAFATGRNPKHGVVAVTTGLLNILNQEELAGVISHELAHIKNRDMLIGTVAATMSGAIMIFADIARFAMIFGGGSRDENGGGGNPLVVLLMSILAPIAAMLIQMAISRSREYLADDTGADIAGTPHGLANALRKLGAASGRIPMAHNSPTAAHLFIVNPLTSRRLSSLFATHPPLEERINRLVGTEV